MVDVESVGVPVKGFVDGKIFYDGSLVSALEECSGEHRALFMSELVDARILSDEGSVFWQKGFNSQSVVVTGRTKGGSAVVVYGHVPSYFSDPANIRRSKERSLEDGAGYFPENEFESLLAQEGEGVFVVDYERLKSSVSGVIGVSEALDHPMVVPFLGGQERAELYLRRHEQVVGSMIGVYHVDDLRDTPVGRLLFVNSSNGNGGLDGCGDLYKYGRFVGVSRSTEGAQKIRSPLEALVGKGTDVGNGLIVIKQNELPDGVYDLLTKQ